MTVCGLLGASCGSSEGDDPAGGETRRGTAYQPVAESQTPEEPQAKPAARRKRGPKVKLSESQFGPVLFDGHDRALYLFTKDEPNRTRCFGACAEAWPPFYAKGRPRAARGVDKSLLGTIRRRGGRRQVTYKDQPLYFYIDDPRGQVLCNDVVEFGGTWFALDAGGDPPS